MTNERRSSNEGKTVVACFLGLGHLDFLCPSSFVLRHFSAAFSCVIYLYIRILDGELIAKRVFPKREVPAIEHEVLFEPICQSGLPLHPSYRCGLLGCGEGFREPTALRISGCERPEKAWFSTT